MKRKLIILSVILAMTLSVTVAAAIQKATLINQSGDKVVVAVGSSDAQRYFADGYSLMGNELGAVSGPNIFGNNARVYGRLITGGKITNASSTLTAARTLTAAEVCDSSIITINNAATTNTKAAARLDITLPATSTLFSCLNYEGAQTSFLFVNASPTAASTTEFVAGTGCEGMISGDTGAADTIAGAGGAALITLIRAKDFYGVNGTSDCIFYIQEWAKD